MTDHAARAVELTAQATIGLGAGNTARMVRAEVAKVHAILALTEAVALVDRTDFDTYRRSTWNEHMARRTSQATSQATSHFTAEQMASDWHAASDHAKDGTPFGGPLCNCERVVMRARRLGWGPTPSATHNAAPNTTHNPVRRPRWDDDLRDAVESSRRGGQEQPNAATPVSESTATIPSPEQAHSRPFSRAITTPVSEPGDLQRVIGQRDRLREGIRSAATRLTPEHPVRATLLALLADDPTHTHPITVAGQPAEERHTGGTK